MKIVFQFQLVVDPGSVKRLIAFLMWMPSRLLLWSIMVDSSILDSPHIPIFGGHMNYIIY
ncbi:hypothetical protein CSV80_15675 [Sporosarcina sp. P12(2017)]|nr:hypothetical protein CSV81_15255 [Sporosarcina sp. P10]PIC59511.1 hypothetical protein CSV80_15675 [Sporosarcina sp. P12(2017)]